ncbi:hypothetical protein [Knoellia koreensis]|uniref:hypothetical protein n=1 Tax=Knoellia koreensis TaxID=2730921 RepID=UPI003211DCC2
MPNACTSRGGSSGDAWRPCATWPERHTATFPPSAQGTPTTELIVYVEAAGDDAATICRNLHGLRLAGWFERANAVLVGRTNAPDAPKLTQREAVLDALGRLDLPIVFDLEIGHVPPHLPLVNGALATVTVDGDTREIVQRLG